MTSETQVVRHFTALLRRHPQMFSGYSSRALRHKIAAMLTRDDLTGGYWFGRGAGSPRSFRTIVRLIERRIRKKAGQPFRRKDRGPLRRRAAGKNEVRRRP